MSVFFSMSSLVNWARSPTRTTIFVHLGFQVSHGAYTHVGSTFFTLRNKKKEKILKQVSQAQGFPDISEGFNLSRLGPFRKCWDCSRRKLLGSIAKTWVSWGRSLLNSSMAVSRRNVV